MKKKRISMVVCIVLSVLLIAVFFAGCGSKSGSTGTVLGGPGGKSHNSEIRVVGGDGRRGGYR